MGNPYLNRDETIILTTQRIRINSTLTDVMLTNQRLILVDPGHAQFRPQTIPLTTIETVMTGEDADGNPVISLSLSALTPQGATQSKELIFSQKFRNERNQERDEWVKQLKEQIASVREQALSIKIISPDRESAIQSGEIKPDRIARYPVDSPFKGTSHSMQEPGLPTEQKDSVAESGSEPVSPDKVTPNYNGSDGVYNTGWRSGRKERVLIVPFSSSCTTIQQVKDDCGHGHHYHFPCTNRGRGYLFNEPAGKFRDSSRTSEYAHNSPRNNHDPNTNRTTNSNSPGNDHTPYSTPGTHSPNRRLGTGDIPREFYRVDRRLREK